MFAAQDEKYMQHALDLAALATNHATPNPRVGCVIVRDGQIIAEGFTQRPGESHAEAQAIKTARSRGVDLTGATAYVTLEPCSHFGRTPPCADALVNSGVNRVIVAMEDPNPMVNGKGMAKLRDAGIVVRAGLLADEARALNIGFIKRMTTGLPWVRMKVAASLDGRTGLADGQSQWITGLEARQDGHHWRARACAILTGSGTILHDDPALTVRGVETVLPLRQPLRVILDHMGKLNPKAKALHGGALVVYSGMMPVGMPPGVELISLPDGSNQNSAGEVKIDLNAVLKELGSRGVNELHVEAGARLMGPFLEAGLVDELLVYIAPKLLGQGAREMFALTSPKTLAEATQFELHDVKQLGEDVRLLLRKPIHN